MFSPHLLKILEMDNPPPKEQTLFDLRGLTFLKIKPQRLFKGIAEDNFCAFDF
jgi:hypothetical protein